MASTTTKPDLDAATPFSESGMPAWPHNQNEDDSVSALAEYRAQDPIRPSQVDALQALLAFSALHEQLRRRKALAHHKQTFDAGAPPAEFTADEQFVLSEVLQLVAERAIAITGADGLAIALAENNEIVLRAAAGDVRPDVGARIDRDSAFSGACFRSAQIVMCDDTETDPRVNLQACRKLGARSMVAVPLCGRRRVIGVLEAFSEWPFGFNDSDVRNLSLLAELVLGALKPEDEDRFAQSAEAAATKLEPPPRPTKPTSAIEPAPMVSAPVVSAPVAPVQTVPVPKVAAPVAPAPIQPATIEPAKLAPPQAVRVAPAVAVPPAPVPVLATRAAEPIVEKVSAAGAPAIPEKLAGAQTF